MTVVRNIARLTQFGGNSEYTDGKAGRGRKGAYLNEPGIEGKMKGKSRKRLTVGKACCIVCVHILSL